MVYTEVSVYGYITGDNLEAYTGIDYSANSAIYTEAVVMAKVTIAERMVNAYLGVSTGQTITDGVITSTIMITAHLMSMDMQIQATNNPISDTYIINTINILKEFLGESSKKRDFALKTDVTDRFWTL